MAVKRRVVLRGTGGCEKSRLCCVWQLECQAGNVTASVQSDHLLQGYAVKRLQSFFAAD